MLKIHNLKTEIGSKKILKGFNLEINAGEVHAIMGPNGSGKSTLAHTLAGRDDINISEGKISFAGQDLAGMSPDQRSLAGIFVAFQYPVELPGVNNAYFLKQAVNAQRQARGKKPLDAIEFLELAKEKLKTVGLSDKFMDRNLNEGFSGGEKKSNEILQLSLLEPKLAVLDETDSGLDIDALQKVAKTVNALRNKDRAFLIITHYPKLLELIKPDFVHVLKDGRIAESGDLELAYKLEKTGYLK